MRSSEIGILSQLKLNEISDFLNFQLILGGCGKADKKAELDDNSFVQGALERTFKPGSMSGDKLPLTSL
jgi:hypothetical protein